MALLTVEGKATLAVVGATAVESKKQPDWRVFLLGPASRKAEVIERRGVSWRRFAVETIAASTVKEAEKTSLSLGQ